MKRPGINAIIAGNYKLGNQFEIVLTILSIYNCRAAEVLNASWNNFFPNDYLILDGCKSSNNVIIRDRIILDAINKLPRLHKTKIFCFLNYAKLYRYVLKNYSHKFNRFKGKKNRKITHGFRYQKVEAIDNEKYIRDILHHRSLKSGTYYKQSKKGKNNEKI